jgi:hypothetical protein
MNRKKSQNPGYQSATGAERIEKLNFHLFAVYTKFLSKVSESNHKIAFIALRDYQT